VSNHQESSRKIVEILRFLVLKAEGVRLPQDHLNQAKQLLGELMEEFEISPLEGWRKPEEPPPG
jgi:hypothetical protein